MGGDREKMRIRELTRTERAKIRKLVTESCANYGGREKQCIPLDCPCYMLDKCWTGSLCRYFQEAVLGADPALESALTGEDSSMRQKKCPVCGKAYLPVTSQAYCSAACRTYARRKSERERKRRERLERGELVRSLAEKRQRFQGFQGPVHRAAKEEYAYLAKQGEAADKRRFLRLIFYLYFCYAGIVGRDADPKGKDRNRAGDYAD